MSIFDDIFKIKKTDETEEKINLLMKVTNNKMSLKETKRMYNILNTEVIQKSPENMHIIDAMDLLDEVKGNWLSKEEKENFVAGLWMFNTLDTTKKENKKYINEEQLKYVKEAVLGTEFKAASLGKYYAEYKEYKYKY